MTSYKMNTSIDVVPDTATTVIENCLDIGAVGEKNLQAGTMIKRAALIAGLTIPTLVNPVLKLDSPTEILLERQFHPFSSIQRLGLDSDEAGVLAALSDYSVSQSTEIESFLRKNKDLVDFLASIQASLKKMASLDSIGLEFYHDLEEHWEKLYIVVDTGIDDMGVLDTLEDSIFSALFEPNSDLISGRVILSVA